jgi:O-antigen/teichoic acid export membrane protein
MVNMTSAIASFYRSKFRQGSFGHNVLIMFTGTAIGQIGAVLLAPVLTRVYSPDMFGVLGLFTAVITITSVISALRYEMALPLAQSDEDAANLLAVCMTVLLCTTILTCVIVSMVSWWNPSDTLFGILAPYGWLLPIGFFCIGTYQMLVYFATRQAAFSVIARTKVYQGTIGPLSQIILGLSGAGTWGLVIGFIIGQSIGISLLFSRLILIPRILSRVSLAGMKGMAKRFRRFPLFSSWSGLIEAAGSSYLLLVAIPLLYSNTIAGFVFLTDRIIGRPLLIISTSILQVYLGDMSRLINDDPDSMLRRFLQLALHQLMIVIGWLAVVNITAPVLFPIVFGDPWQGAVPYLQILSIAYLPQMVVHALVHTLQILERQVMSAIWEGARFLAVCGTFVISYTCGLNALQALLAYSVVQALSQIILFALMYHSIQSLRKEHPHA